MPWNNPWVMHGLGNGWGKNENNEKERSLEREK
jgi:hypothetical protein